MADCNPAKPASESRTTFTLCNLSRAAFPPNMQSKGSQAAGSGTIQCPQCGHQFEMSDALTAQLRDDLKDELQADISRREAEVKQRLDAITTQKDALQREKLALDEEVERKLKARVAETTAKAEKKVEERLADQMRELRESLREREDSIKTFRDNELALRKKQRELEQAREEAEIVMQRKLDEERAKIRKDAEVKAGEAHRLKDMEKELMIQDLRDALADMKRRAEQGSMERQGEALELDFEQRLGRMFVHDRIAPVPKGIRGADLIQTVRTVMGAECGMILWETKNAKSWSGQWLQKLKADMIEVRASLAILVTVTLPEGVERFGHIEGVWVSDPASAIPLAFALRHHLLAIEGERQASIGKNEKMELLYQYLAGTQFKQKIEGIVEAFSTMQAQISVERRAMEKQWKEREKQIERVMKNTTGLYGDMQGIIGGSIPRIAALELDAPVLQLIADDTEDSPED